MVIVEGASTPFSSSWSPNRCYCFKASEILGIEGGIVIAPSQPTVLMVLSKTSKLPHFTIRKNKGGLACVEDSSQYTSACFSSHVVAVAQ